MYIIITDFNGWSRTQRCLDALRKSHFSDFSVVVVEHGTNNETQNNLNKLYPEVIRLSGSQNLWWSGATNLGVQYALHSGADAIMLLNNDCYVTPYTIGELVSIWVRQKESIIAPVQRDWETGNIMAITPSCLFLLGFPSMHGPRKLTSFMKTRQLLPTKIILGGRGVLINGSIFRSIGFFDEKYLPHYGADHDFYLRASKNNIKLFTATRAIVDIDNSHTTVANNSGKLSFQEWIQSLSTPRSHYNLIHLIELFKRHYPLKRLFMFGVALYISRYTIMYILNRIIHLLFKCINNIKRYV